MTPAQDYLDGRFTEALVQWADQLAVGRTWREVKAEIVSCCEGRVDLLTALLIHAEGDPSSPSAPCLAVPSVTPFPRPALSCDRRHARGFHTRGRSPRVHATSCSADRGLPRR